MKPLRSIGNLYRDREGAPTRKILCIVALSALLLATLTCGSGNLPSPRKPPGEITLKRLSTDTFSNSSSQHATEVEPDTFAFGSTIVSAFQVGRRLGGGGADIGFATSTDGGTTWVSGFLPGVSIYYQGGAFDGASDPVVAFDAAHGVWLIASLTQGTDVLVSRSPDGINWSDQITDIPTPSDKDWIVCDNGAGSPFFGHCYLQWDDPNTGLLWMSTSTNGGLTWGPTLNPADSIQGGGGQPVVQPNGSVVVPFWSWVANDMRAITSSDGGASWSASVQISPITDHAVAGGLRSAVPLPSAEVDADGTVYVVWSDCRFRTGCSSNDLVMSTSADGMSWTPPARVPIDPVTSTVDHFIPGLAVDPATRGNTAHLTLAYYWYSQTNCTASDCALNVGFVVSQDGGSTWSAPQTLAGPMSLAWLANTNSGRMVGDYISTSYIGGQAYAVFAVARANSGTTFDEAMYTTEQPLPPLSSALHFSSKGEKPVPNAKSDHGPRKFQDEEHEISLPPAPSIAKSPSRSY
jgi:hypothetical protein